MTHYTTEQLAEILTVSTETLRAWRRTGRGPRWFKLSGSRLVRYADVDVEEWLRDARLAQ